MCQFYSLSSRGNTQSCLQRLYNTIKTILDFEFCRRLFDWEETELLDQSTQDQLHFFLCKTHGHTITRTHSERHESVWIQVCLILRSPPSDTKVLRDVLLGFG